MPLKMKLHLKLCLIFFATSLYCAAQNTTVFITSADEPEKKTGSGFFSEFAPFSQFAISFPFRSNPEYGETNNSDSNNNWFIPDGLSAHGGFGVHVYESIAFSANTGVDWQITPKLVSVPVYGSVLLNPSVSDESSILIQAGLGKAFAIGHGDISGTYQKYRLGYFTNYYGIYGEINFYGYAWNDAPQMSTINVGICLLNFE